MVGAVYGPYGQSVCLKWIDDKVTAFFLAWEEWLLIAIHQEW